MGEDSSDKFRTSEENGLSFSISKILHGHPCTRKVTETCKHGINEDEEDDLCSNTMLRCHGLETAEENFHESMLPYQWPLINKQSYRRIGHPYQSRAAPKRKKPRTTFSRAQIAELEQLFTEKKYLTSTERQRVANYLGLSDCQVKTWFQNRRTKHKRETEEEKEENRHAMTRTMLGWQKETLQKERFNPFVNYHHLNCTLSKSLCQR